MNHLKPLLFAASVLLFLFGCEKYAVSTDPAPEIAQERSINPLPKKPTVETFITDYDAVYYSFYLNSYENNFSYSFFSNNLGEVYSGAHKSKKKHVDFVYTNTAKWKHTIFSQAAFFGFPNLNHTRFKETKLSNTEVLEALGPNGGPFLKSAFVDNPFFAGNGMPNLDENTDTYFSFRTTYNNNDKPLQYGLFRAVKTEFNKIYLEVIVQKSDYDGNF